MTVVVDASVALSWHFDDESAALPLGSGSFEQEIWVPAHWPAEVANGLWTGQRNDRTDPARIERFAQLIAALPIAVDALPLSEITGPVLTIARGHGLTVYDAAYVEPAQRRSASLASFDGKMRRAARKLGIALIGD